jgi:hypothetical protein
MGLPITSEVQRKFARNLAEAIAAKQSGLVGAWDSQTGFFISAQVANGHAHWWECFGPVTQDQAQELAHENVA